MWITDDYGDEVRVKKPDDLEDLKEMGVRMMRAEGSLKVGEVRMARTEAAMEQIRADVEQMKSDMIVMKSEMGDNTKLTKEVLSGLDDVVEFFTAMKGAFKVLNWVGTVAKPVAAIVGLGTAIFVAYGAWTASK